MRYFYMREYTYYPFLYSSMFLTGMLDYNTLEARRKIFLGKHFYKLISGRIYNPYIMKEINLYVPNKYTRGRSHDLFYAPKTRTSSYRNAPINRAIQLLNDAASSVDIFNTTYRQFSDYLLTYATK